MLAQKTIAIPTLTMMEMVVANRNLPRAAYHAARDSVTAFYKAGIPILASTDANSQPGVPAQPEHGESLHHELELMIEAGMSSLEVLRAATSVPAGYFGLRDRGSVGVGKRADLVLVDGNPLEGTWKVTPLRVSILKGTESSSGAQFLGSRFCREIPY